MTWTVLNFGKHEGKSLPQVLFTDPDWFFWAYDEGVFRERGALDREARDLHRKATSVRIPLDVHGEPRVVEYIYFPGTWRFAGFDLVEQSRMQHQGSSPTARSRVLSFETPRNAKSYDKLGAQIFLKAFKAYFFNDSKFKMTKDRCEAFFDDTRNFV